MISVKTKFYKCTVYKLVQVTQFQQGLGENTAFSDHRTELCSAAPPLPVTTN